MSLKTKLILTYILFSFISCEIKQKTYKIKSHQLLNQFPFKQKMSNHFNSEQQVNKEEEKKTTDHPFQPASNTSSQVQVSQEQVLRQVEMMQQPKFFQIIDVVVEYQKGNFLPALHCLRYNLIPKDFQDYGGYNILHHAVSYNNIPVVLILLDHFKIDPNIRSKINQTGLMIACNFGYTEIINILCERGADVNSQEDTRFSPLLYTVKQGLIPHFCYLLYMNADIQIRDANGCGVVHWAAYKNNIFFLRLFKRIGLDLNTSDITGMTPLDRAVQSEAYDAVKYLVENGEQKLPSNMKFDEIANQDIKEYLRRRYFKTKFENLQDQSVEYFRKNSEVLTFGVYIFMWLIMMKIYINAVLNQGFDYYFDLCFIVFGLYFILYAYWYFLKSQSSIEKVKKFAYQKLHIGTQRENDKANSSYPMQMRLNFDALNKLLRDEKESIINENENEVFASFLHELAYHFKAKNYREISKFDAKEFCPSCLSRRELRSKHPRQSKSCVSHFYHYSETLKSSIHKKNHFFYFILLLKQTMLLFGFLLAIFLTYYPKLNNWKIYLVEVGYYLSVEFNTFYGIFYAAFIVLYIYSSFFFLIEVHGILNNITYNELFNRNRYNYLFKIKQDAKGAFVKYFKNPYDQGYISNVKEYFQRTF